jgi:hypothetical protein
LPGSARIDGLIPFSNNLSFSPISCQFDWGSSFPKTYNLQLKTED